MNPPQEKRPTAGLGNGNCIGHWRYLAALYRSISEFTKALSDFEQCIALDPHAPAPYFNWGSTFDALGRREEAIKDIDRFLELVENQQWRKAARDLLKQWQAEFESTQTDRKRS